MTEPQIIRLAANATVAKLIGASKTAVNKVSELLSYAVEGAAFAQSFGANKWDGRSSFYARRTDSFPAGFVHMVHATLVNDGHKVQIIKHPAPAPQGPASPVVDEFGNDDPRYDFQMTALRQVEKHHRGILQVATGGGKCLGRDTPILMYDGSIKMVQDVIVGDLLMGPDSKSRNVLSICAGVDPLYRVTPTKGEPYVVNNAHILSLKKTSRGFRGLKRDGEKYPKGGIVNINVEDYLTKNKTFHHTHKGWRTGVDFASASALPIDPYFVGLLLGDGSINGTVSLTTADSEMVTEVERQAAIWGLKVMPYSKTKSINEAKTYHLTAGRSGGKSNPLTSALRDVGLGAGAKFVPHIYKTASREDRLQLLAGLLDTDGYYDGKCLYLTLKCERLMNDAIFIARSLGFAAYKKAVKKTCCNNGKVGDYFSTVISGDLDQIPVRLDRRKANPRLQKKNHLVSGLKIEAIGEGEYFGFQIDGDSLFLLGDFTVTHNSKVAKLVVARYRRMTLFLTTRGILMYQMADGFKEAGFNVGYIGDGLFRPTRSVNVGMVQTFVARLEVPDLNGEIRNAVRQDAETREKLHKKGLPAGAVASREEFVRIGTERFNEKTRTRAQTIKLLEMFEVVIGEEAHEAGGNSYYEILRHCKNAHVRVALTATPFMRAGAEDNMRLMAAFGPILLRVSEKELINRGILATPYFRFVDSKPHPKLRKTSPYQRAYQLGYLENSFMLDDIVKEATRAAELGLPVMTLIQRTSHGDTLAKLMREAGLRVEFIHGENDQVERKRALTRLKRGEIDVLIGTTILDVGVDVPAVGLVQLAGGGKAEVALRQRIGRGLRAKKNGPNVCFVSDYSTLINICISDHTRQRRQIIKDTEGFGAQVLEPGRDFDWSMFKKSSRVAA